MTKITKCCRVAENNEQNLACYPLENQPSLRIMNDQIIMNK